MRTESNNLLGFKIIDLTDDSTVNTSTTNDQTIQPPNGLMYLPTTLYIYIPDPSGSSSGTHGLYLAYDVTDITRTGIWKIVSNTGNSIGTYYGAFNGDNESPSTSADQQRAISGICHNWITYDRPVTLRYTNDTDVNQTGTRKVIIGLEVHKNVL